MSFKKTSETLIKGSHTLDQKYYLNQDILDQEYNNIFLNHGFVQEDYQN